MLKVSDLSKTFGGLSAVDGISLSVAKGALMGVIGPNGSGKTTFFNLLTGFLAPSGGTIEFEGKSISGLSPEQIVRRGIARTFQTVRFHKDSTVRETVWTAQAMHLGIVDLFRGANSCGQRELAEEVEQILEMTWLSDHANKLARELPFGLVRQLEIARALATRPQLLLMDEPASGMNPTETHKLTEDIRRIHAQGITVVLIEHDVGMVTGLCGEIVVLNFGKKIARGGPSTITADPNVIAAYLGSRRKANA